MDKRCCRPISIYEIINRYGRTDRLPLEYDKHTKIKLNTNLIVPSVNIAYSTCIEYMTKWFLSKFGENFFKSTFLEEAHALHYLRSLPKRKLIVPNKPSLTITADEDISYNNENVDLYNLGANLYQNRARYQDAFFADRERNLFISLTREILLMNFSFRMRFDGRPIQLDIGKMCQLAFRIGGTEKHYVDLDYPVPKELIDQLSYEALGLCIKDGDLEHVTEFIKYFNMHSRLPLMYKYDTGTSHFEYFLKMPADPIHIRCENLNMDNGVDRGLVKMDYNLSFDAQVRFPTPKFYAYYSMNHWQTVRSITRVDKEYYLKRCFSFSRVPNKNENGWPWMANTEYVFQGKEVDMIKAKKLMHIDFYELIGNLRDLIDYTKSLALSPALFLDIRVYNFTHYVKTEIDWVHYRINFLEPIESERCYLIIYMDQQYVNEKLIDLKNYKNERINPTVNQIGPDMSLKDKKMIY